MLQMLYLSVDQVAHPLPWSIGAYRLLSLPVQPSVIIEQVVLEREITLGERERLHWHV